MGTTLKADLILKNAYVWTADVRNPEAEAIAIYGDRILYVGASESDRLDELVDGDTKIINLQNKMVMPALFDSHLHISAVAKSGWFFIMTKEEHSTKESIKKALKKYALEHPKEEVPYIYAESCPTVIMDDPEMTKEYIDDCVSDRPVLLCDYNYHRSLINSKMLELLEITGPDSFKGSENRNFQYDENGDPTGIVDERAFEDIVDVMYEKVNWRPPSQADGYVMLPFLDFLTKCGVCYVFDGVTEGEDTFIGLSQLQREGKLNHYYEGTRLIKEIGELENAIAEIKNWQYKYGSPHINVNTLKVFLDGTNEIGTSALLEPYSNDPDGEFCGELEFSEEEMIKVFDRANDEKLDLQVHMVGDRAFRTALDAIEKAQHNAAKKGLEWVSKVIFLHCELIDPADRGRVAPLGVFINWTPHWSGGDFGDVAKTYLGEERFNRMYSFNELISSGATVGYGSDVVDMEEEERADPFLGIQIGHTRYDHLHDTGLVRPPESEKLSIHDLLMGYTINNAIAMGYDKNFGSLEAGKSSNLIVLNQNVFQVKDDEISKTRPVFFLFDGKELINELE